MTENGRLLCLHLFQTSKDSEALFEKKGGAEVGCV